MSFEIYLSLSPFSSINLLNLWVKINSKFLKHRKRGAINFCFTAFCIATNSHVTRWLRQLHNLILADKNHPRIHTLEPALIVKQHVSDRTSYKSLRRKSFSSTFPTKSLWK